MNSTTLLPDLLQWIAIAVIIATAAIVLALKVIRFINNARKEGGQCACSSCDGCALAGKCNSAFNNRQLSPNTPTNHNQHTSDNES